MASLPRRWLPGTITTFLWSWDGNFSCHVRGRVVCGEDLGASAKMLLKGTSRSNNNVSERVPG